MNKKVMILGASILQLPAIQQAKKMGLDVVVVDMNESAIGFDETGIKKEIISTIDIPAVVNAAKKHKIDGIMTLATDMPMRTVAAVAKEMGLVGIDEDTALKATNKAEMRKALEVAGVPIPKFLKVQNKDEYRNAVRQFVSPFVVKPADNSGSRGIVLVSDITDKMSVEDAYTYSQSFSRNGDVLVEEYMQGKEVSVETLSINGECHVIQITDKITTGAPHFVEMGHSQPTCFDEDTIEKITNVAIAANRAVGILDGPSHTEIIVTSDGPKIVEIGARLGGDCITTHLVPLSTGVNMVECCIKIALGEKPDIDHKFNKGSAIRYLQQIPGEIKSISGIEEAQLVEGVEQVSVLRTVGETITAIDSSSARMGFVIASGEDAAAAIQICERASAFISIGMQCENDYN